MIRPRRNPPAYLVWYRTTAWRRRSASQLSLEPWCRFHAERGERVKATVADHVTPHRGVETAFWSGALQSLCARCHSSVKQAIEAGKRAGCDASGLPIDPGHPWSGEAKPR
jgi:hypothetical protein